MQDQARQRLSEGQRDDSYPAGQPADSHPLGTWQAPPGCPGSNAIADD
jgi:hypothetical protein